jgi:hypothetical protein
MAVCSGGDLLDFELVCVRVFWSTLLPAIVVLLLSLFGIPKPAFVRKAFAPVLAPFHDELSLEQAEAFEASDAYSPQDDALSPSDESSYRPPFWRTFLLVSLALLESLVWIFVGSLEIFNAPKPIYVAQAYVTALSWLYATVRPVARSVKTAPYDLFILFFVHLVTEALQLGGIIYENTVYNVELPPPAALAAHLLNLIVVLVVLVLVMSIPVNIPSSRVDRSKIV